jgi:fatty acid desaturase
VQHDVAHLTEVMQRSEILTDRQPARYLVRLAFNVAAVGLCAVFLKASSVSWAWLLLNSTLVAFFLVQCIIVAHDAMHRQVFQGPRKNDLLALFIWNFLIGLSNSWFFAYHSKHHVQSNRVQHDPNLEIPFLLTGRDSILGLKGWRRQFAKYQAFLFLPFLFLSGGDFLGRTFRFLRHMKKSTSTFYAEIGLMALHYVLFIGYPVYVLGVAKATPYILWHYLIAGFYGGLIFATNHMGMPLVSPDDKVDFVTHQVTTARNLTPHVVNNFIFAGLNYQIEHHLFPSIAYHKLDEARAIVRAHCEERTLHYHEVGLFRTFIEMHQSLHAVGAPLREGASARPSDGLAAG